MPDTPFSSDPDSGSTPPDGDDPLRVESVNHSPVAARVPEHVAKGTFCTGQVILDGPKELVIDFLQGLTRPFQVVSRVVLAPQTASELSDALTKNIEMFTQRYGPTPPVPGPPPQNRPTVQEVYEHFRVPEDLLSGTYANSVLIGHSPTEFFFDFITGFYPTSAVAARVFLPTAQAPRLLTALNASIKQHQLRFRKPEGDSSPGELL